VIEGGKGGSSIVNTVFDNIDDNSDNDIGDNIAKSEVKNVIVIVRTLL